MIIRWLQKNLKLFITCCQIIAKKVADEYEINVGHVKKSIPNLNNKTKYIVHYKNLQLHLSLEMKLTKINRVLKLKQSDWMKNYIDFNTEEKQKLLINPKKTFSN